MTWARLVEGVCNGLIGAGLLIVILYVHTEAYQDEVLMERERAAAESAGVYRQYRGRCAETDQEGRRLVATVRGTSDWGSLTLDCYYERKAK